MRLEFLDIFNAGRALVAIINPLGNLPAIVELTSDLGRHTRWRRPLYDVGHTRGDEAVEVKEVNFAIRRKSLAGGWHRP